MIIINKINFIKIIAIGLLILTIQCNSKDELKTPVIKESNPEFRNYHKLIGQWRYVCEDGNRYNNIGFIFFNNGTLVQIDSGTETKGKWTLENNNIMVIQIKNKTISGLYDQKNLIKKIINDLGYYEKSPNKTLPKNVSFKYKYYNFGGTI